MNGWLAAGLLAAPLSASGAELRRPPAVAGQFYPAEEKALSDLVEGYLKTAEGEAVSVKSADLVAVLAPHAGLEFSGATAAKAFRLLEPGRWDSVIVVGTGHYKGVAGAALYPGDYGTSEGWVPYDKTLAQRLMEASPLIAADPAAHEKEHSIEVELPFLKRRLGNFKLAALVMNTQDLETARAVGRAIAKAVKGRRVLLVASSDLSHYPPADVAKAVDRATLKALESLDPEYFWLANRLVMKRGLKNLSVSYCGESAVAAVMEAAKELGAAEVKVLARSNSYDAAPRAGKERVVGYAAAAFVKPRGKKARAESDLPERDKDELLKLARRSIADYLSTGRLPEAGFYGDPAFNLPAAVFVTLRRDGALRGCIGTLSAQESLAESVVRNAVASAVDDPRFKPVTAAELPELRIEISVLSAAQPARGAGEIRKGDGVILEQGEHSGVFLPQVWEQIADKEDFLAELCGQKAGLPRDCYKDPRTKIKVFAARAFEERR